MPALDSELDIDEIVSDLEEFTEALGEDYEEQDAELVDQARKLLHILSGMRYDTACYRAISIDAKIKIITSITNYKIIMTPSTGLMFNCCSCCNKKKRQKKHDSKCAHTSLQLIEAMYISQVYDIKYKCDGIIKECHQSEKFADTLRQVSSTTSILEIKNTTESRSSSKEKLSVLLSRLEMYKVEFLSSKGEGSKTSNANPTRFRNVQVALAANPSNSNSYVSYKKANKLLFDLASFGTSLLIFKTDEKIKVLEDHVKSLQKIHAALINDVDILQKSSFTQNLVQESAMLQIKDDAEHLDGVVHGKLVGASFEWSELKTRISSSSFLSTYFGSADDDIENLFSTASFMATPSVGSNIVPKAKTASKDSNLKSPQKNVSDFFNNIKLPNNKKPQDISNANEPPIYNLKTQLPVSSNVSKGNGHKKFSSEDYLPQKTAKKTATSFSSSTAVDSSSQNMTAPSFDTDVIDFEDSPTMSSSAFLSDSSSDSSSRHSFSTARKSNFRGGSSSGKTNSIFSEKFNSKLNKVSGSLSRTASKASAKVSETREKVSEKVATSAPRRMLKNSYTSLKNKSDGF